MSKVQDAVFTEVAMRVDISIPLKNGVGSVVISCDPSKDEILLSIPGLDRVLTISRNDFADAFSRIGPRFDPSPRYGLPIRPIGGGGFDGSGVG